MSKQFEFADLVGKKVVGVAAEFSGGPGTDDYVGLDISDGSQVQIVGQLGTLKAINGDLEEMLDREIVSADHVNFEANIDYDYIVVDTFVITVVSAAIAGGVRYDTLIIQYVNEEPGILTVECKA